jgi:SPP1 gp7 family putative phage head morphogenesis protein
MIPLLERYNAQLRTLEDTHVLMLNRILDASFNRLIRRVRVHMRAGYVDPVNRNLALLQDFRQLVPAYRPDRVDAYDRLLRSLLGSSGRYGLGAAGDLTAEMDPARKRLDVSIPLDATVAAAAQAKGYLVRHGQTFAETSAATVAQGIAEGRPTDAITRDLQERLSVTRSRAETIARTESLRSYNLAANRYYAAHGVDEVMYYATADDRTCPTCAPRAGQLYRRGEISVPLHPRCRCYLAPWSLDSEKLDPSYAARRGKHADEVARHYNSTQGLPSLSRAAVFEQIAPSPLQA